MDLGVHEYSTRQIGAQKGEYAALHPRHAAGADSGGRELILGCQHQLLGVEPPPPSEARTTAEWVLHLTGTDLTRCPRCGHGSLIRIELRPRPGSRGHLPPPPIFDSS